MSRPDRGQRRYRREHQRAALQRVRAYEAWKASGFDTAVPASLPTDHDLKTYRRLAGKGTR